MGAGESRSKKSKEVFVQPDTQLELGAHHLPDDTLSTESNITLSLARKGVKLLRITDKGENSYFLQLRDKAGCITFCQLKKGRKSSKQSNIALADIEDVWEGCKTDVLNKHAEENARDVESTCFSVVYGEDRDTLDFEATSEEIRDHWVEALRALIAKYKAFSEQDTQNRWLQEYFQLADKKRDGVLSFEEISDVLEKMNVDMKKEDIRKLLRESSDAVLAKCREDHKLDFKAFAHFYKQLTRRPEIEKIFARFAKGDVYLRAPALRSFLQMEQKETELSDNAVAQLIQKHEPMEENKRHGRLSIVGFRNLLRGDYGDIFNHRHEEVNMDMTKPLTKYFMASSHNTYLTEHQMKGPASVETYVYVLEKGCRFVELDCYDGPDDDPKVTHGFTLTGAVKLRDVCDAIRDFAFKASPYPVVLSIENHCSVEQQRIMAQIFIDTFGEKLYLGPVCDALHNIPSPEELKYKIIIKNKKLSKPEQTLDLSDDEDEDDREAEMNEVGKQILGEAEDNNDKPQEHAKAGKKKQLAVELSNLVRIFVSKHFNGFDDALETHTPGHISSLKEPACDKLIKQDIEKFMKVTSKTLIKVYPGAKRMFDSSNLDPYHYWPAGIQVVAMNYQYAGENMQLNEAMFAQNGRCGYVLKPSFLTSGDGLYTPDKEYRATLKRTIRVTVISGQNIPKPSGETRDIVDPYVKLKLYGVESDVQTERTRTVQSNGLNPEWSQEFLLNVHVPELAFLQFVVKDEDKYSQNDFIGQFTLTVNSLKQGYRHVHLRDEKDRSMAPASLFVHIDILQPN